MERILCKNDKNDTSRVWKIIVTKNTINVEYGVKEGKIIKKTQTITKGKNMGKKNETTPEQQAILEAKSKIRKKIDEGYSDFETNTSITSVMLAHDYKQHRHKIRFPCYIQPKLDGYRMVYNPETCDMSSRNNKKYNSLYNTKLHKELQDLDIFLDGELYVHDKDYSFENYGILRKKEIKEKDISKIDKIKYHVFDVICTDKKTFKERLEVIKTLKKYKYIIPVETFLCYSEKDIDELHSVFLEKGYEGSMVRNMESLYTNHRSYDLLKYKDFNDMEFKIIGFSCEKNLSDDNLQPVIWKCITDSKKTFEVQSKGSRKERDILYKHGSDYIGKMLTVKFFGFTEEGIPRFPKTLRKGFECF